MRNYKLMNDYIYIIEKEVLNDYNLEITTIKEHKIISDFLSLFKYSLRVFKQQNYVDNSEIDMDDLYNYIVEEIRSSGEEKIEIDSVEINEELVSFIIDEMCIYFDV